LEVESIVQKNLEINSSLSDEINEKRFWEVVGFAKVPCGGTHLKRTGEVGKLKLKRKNIGKGKERIEIYLGSESE
jgi:Ser-tRNA(Ala) deacylase AlaX